MTTKLIFILCALLESCGISIAQAPGFSPLFEKFGWKNERRNEALKKTKTESSARSGFLAEWEKTLNFDYYKRTLPDRFAKLIRDVSFTWAIYVDDYYRGDFGESMGARFAGRTTDGRLLLLGKNFKGHTNGALLNGADWKKLDALNDLEKYAHLDWMPLIDLRFDEDLPRSHDEALALYCFWKGKRKEAVAASLAGGVNPGEAMKAQIAAMRALQKAFRFADPEVSLPLRLKSP